MNNLKVKILDLVQNNAFFRQEILTGPNSQIVIMSIKPGEDIGLESHKVDQILIFTQGTGQAIIGENKYSIEPGSLFLVPAGTQHNFTNTGSQDLKLFTIYAPAQHKPGTVHKTKTEAEKAEKY